MIQESASLESPKGSDLETVLAGDMCLGPDALSLQSSVAAKD